MNCYMDNSATTPVYPEIVEVMAKLMVEDFGNPSSMHKMGVAADMRLREARELIAATLKCDEKNIIFTSGGTESDNLAIFGACEATKRAGKHIITTPFEHSAVKECMEYLKKNEYEISYLSVDKNGIIDMEELKSLIREDTVLVSIMGVNNEMGAVQDIETIGNVIKETNPKTLFHVDAIQYYGKYVIAPKRFKIDLMAVSGHKIHGPKGTGFLYVSDKVRIIPQTLGGGQQNAMRSGTENVPGYVGLALACKLSYENFDEKIATMRSLKNHFSEEVAKIEGVRVNTSMEESVTAPHIVSVSVENVRSEVLLHTLEDAQIYVSAGSACSSHKRAPSASLVAIGVPEKLLGSTVRFSFSDQTTLEQIDYCIKTLQDVIPKLNIFVRR